MTSDNDGSKSLCTKHEFCPIHYHWYRDESNRSLLEEIRQLAVDAGLTSRDVSRVVGEARGRLRSLRQGLLKPVEHVKGPMETVTDIDIFEVRVNVEVAGARNFAVRVYHVEPRTLRRRPASTIVGLLVHAKDFSDPTKVRDEQDAELAAARQRFHDGRATNWGDAGLLPLDDVSG
jgi:hypothetical protein